MNKENILRLADVVEAKEHLRSDWDVESEKEGFNMSIFSSCNTPRCIAGWANALAGRKVLESDTSAADFLGLPYPKAISLFYPNYPFVGSYNNITPHHAATVLRHLAETGEVDWTQGVEA